MGIGGRRKNNCRAYNKILQVKLKMVVARNRYHQQGNYIMKLQNNTFFLKELHYSLDDLCKRLQDDYNGDKKFEQLEDDRMAVWDACELLEELLGK